MLATHETDQRPRPEGCTHHDVGERVTIREIGPAVILEITEFGYFVLLVARGLRGNGYRDIDFQ